MQITANETTKQVSLYLGYPKEDKGPIEFQKRALEEKQTIVPNKVEKSTKELIEIARQHGISVFELVDDAKNSEAEEKAHHEESELNQELLALERNVPNADEAPVELTQNQSPQNQSDFILSNRT